MVSSSFPAVYCKWLRSRQDKLVVCVVVCGSRAEEKKCKNTTDNIVQNYLFFPAQENCDVYTPLNSTLSIYRLDHINTSREHFISFYRCRAEESIAREMSGPPPPALPTPSYDPPAWAGKPAAGLHLDVTKDTKLVQKLMIDEKKSYLFGRNPQMNDFTIDHGSCSRVHAALLWHKHLERSFLVDLGSSKCYLTEISDIFSFIRYYSISLFQPMGRLSVL